MPKPVGLLPVAPATSRPPMFRALAIAASGLSAQRQRLETSAANIANADTTRSADGTPYRRRTAVLAAGDTSQAAGPLAPGQTVGRAGPFTGVPPFHVPSGTFPAAAGGATDSAKSYAIPVLETNTEATGVHIAQIAEDATDGPLVYDPGHPDADANGYVRYPNVRITDEMVDMMDARRVYEANATVFQSAKAMLRRALEI